MCLVRLLLCPNFLSHKVQLWGFSRVWVSLCVFKLDAVENAFVQIVHWWGFPFVCIWLCLVKLLELLQEYIHCEQWNVFTVLWVSLCWVRVLGCLNKPHIWKISLQCEASKSKTVCPIDVDVFRPKDVELVLKDCLQNFRMICACTHPLKRLWQFITL